MYHKDIGSCEMYRHKTNARVQIPEGEKFMNERNVRPFSKRDEIGYVFGDMAGSFVLTPIHISEHTRLSMT